MQDKSRARFSHYKPFLAVKTQKAYHLEPVLVYVREVPSVDIHAVRRQRQKMDSEHRVGAKKPLLTHGSSERLLLSVFLFTDHLHVDPNQHNCCKWSSPQAALDVAPASSLWYKSNQTQVLNIKARTRLIQVEEKSHRLTSYQSSCVLYAYSHISLLAFWPLPFLTLYCRVLPSSQTNFSSLELWMHLSFQVAQ
jgi:hypothetical protein